MLGVLDMSSQNGTMEDKDIFFSDEETQTWSDLPIVSKLESGRAQTLLETPDPFLQPSPLTSHLQVMD